MDPNQKFERKRHFIIAIPTGILAAIMVFVAIGCIQEAKQDAKWLLVLVLILPLLVLLSRTSAVHLRAALNYEESTSDEPPNDDDSP